MANPELPYLAAGAVAVLGATIRDHKLPELTTPVIGTIGLVIVASATANSRIAPLVSALGYMLLLTTSMAAVSATIKRVKVRK